MADVLEKIFTARQKSLAQAKLNRPWHELQSLLPSCPSVRPFGQALLRPGELTLIAEMKQRSPSAGDLRADYRVEAISSCYERAGAKALSVLTEADFFGGDIGDVVKVFSSCPLPILRKDFIFDPYQLLEARVAGASAVLLIAELCEDSLLQELVCAAREFGLETLVEVFLEQSIPKALKTGSMIVGINTRNLRTLEMRSDNVAMLKRHIPPQVVVVAESGIKTVDDVKRLKELGVHAMLVGESLLKQLDLEAATRYLVEAGKL